MKSARRHDAFTVVELVVVILIIGILAGVAAPRLLELQQEAAENATVTQALMIFRAAEAAFAERGQWPANTVVGEFPPELEGFLPERAFTESSPIGRKFDWNGPGTGMPTYGVSIPPPFHTGSIQSIDDRHDNGDLSTGWITESRGGAINFELAPK